MGCCGHGSSGDFGISTCIYVHMGPRVPQHITSDRTRTRMTKRSAAPPGGAMRCWRVRCKVLGNGEHGFRQDKCWSMVTLCHTCPVTDRQSVANRLLTPVQESSTALIMADCVQSSCRMPNLGRVTVLSLKIGKI
eukprot:350287-Chlamydomonas_euryale.AAC.2